MSLRNIYRKDVVSVKSGTMVNEVASLMQEKNIGSVVVQNAARRGEKEEFGIVTDRDIALRVIGKNLDPAKTPIADVMTHNFVLVLREDLGLLEALEQVRKSAVRRFPVIGIDGKLKGIITLDDIITLLAKEMADVASIIENEGPLL